MRPPGLLTTEAFAPAHRGPSNLVLRVASAAVLAPAAAAAWVAGGSWLFLLVTAATIACSVEWVRLSAGPAWIRLLPAAVAAPLAAIGLNCIASPIVVLAIVVGCIPAGIVAARLAGASMPIMTGMGIIYAAAFGVALHGLAFAHDGSMALPWLAVVVWASDIGGYAAGRALGGPRLAPRISPGKTWSGLAGAVCLAALAGGIASNFGAGPASVIWGALIASALGIVGQCGDLMESALKRRAGVKDSSRLIPGHGGALDRLDAMMATAPCLLLALELGAR